MTYVFILQKFKEEDVDFYLPQLMYVLLID